MVNLPEIADRPELAQCAGDPDTIADDGSIMRSDTLLAPCIIGNRHVPSEAKIVVTFDKANSTGPTMMFRAFRSRS